MIEFNTTCITFYVYMFKQEDNFIPLIYHLEEDLLNDDCYQCIFSD